MLSNKDSVNHFARFNGVYSTSRTVFELPEFTSTFVLVNLLCFFFCCLLVILCFVLLHAEYFFLCSLRERCFLQLRYL